MKYFYDKIVVVTGAGSGIGKAVCQILGKETSAIVIAIDINYDACKKTIQEINQNLQQAFACDVSDFDHFSQVIEKIYARFLRIDILFNNAGIGIAGEIKSLNIDDWYRIIDTNIKGVIHGTHLVYQKMLQQKQGHIINIACLAGLIPFPDVTVYSMSKHAIVGFSCALAFEAAKYGIRVTMVCPSAVDTEIVHNSKYVGMSEEFVEQMWRKIPKMSPDRFVFLMLRKVARGKKVILLPFSSRFVWWLYRLCPSVVLRCLAIGAKWAKSKEKT
ncbi:SDR family NAD(P)-dependent oxidoreductase [Candidatus Uabimicrobium amorphum]|uniref:Short-chain dehydrogenase n=1 Tax=Uabimicrobium amorphum TaxID=2596890 RepID=A0A5S9F5G0_UABAM|nr:SDR family oxidoreductase [Candidatus Uabimicrobium amorphum]BBM86796.1 short-chain dehydrogenase [Candidatus Uabimicrobium amorphum]